MNRAARLAQWQAAHQGPFSCDGMIPNPPCSRCARSLESFCTWGGTRIAEHDRRAREEHLNLCPKCYDDLVAWLDLEPVLS